MAAESRMLRARRRLQECAEVNRLAYEGLGVSLIATRLGFSRHKVYALLRWLGWRDEQQYSKWAKSKVAWQGKYPDDEAAA
jgi:DNA invertase Pin-like site-specific DNA recombinase